MADRLRVVSNTGQNLRINVDTGGTLTDGNINGASNADICAIAYTNSVPGATSTQLYGIAATSGTLYLQDPPNEGKLTRVTSFSLDVTSVNGYDIDGRTNIGYLVVNGSTPYLNSIEPGKSPAGRQLSEIGDNLNESFVGLALR